MKKPFGIPKSHASPRSFSSLAARSAAEGALTPAASPSPSTPFASSHNPQHSSAACCATLPPHSAFRSTSRLPGACSTSPSAAAPAKKLALPGPLAAERTPRELRLAPQSLKTPGQIEEITLSVPGEASAFGWRFRAQSTMPGPSAIIRNWRPGDRVTLRYSSGPRKLKEVLDRLKVSGDARGVWPVVEWRGQIVWMQGAELQPIQEMAISAEKEELL